MEKKEKTRRNKKARPWGIESLWSFEIKEEIFVGLYLHKNGTAFPVGGGYEQYRSRQD